MKPTRVLALVLCLGWLASGSCCCIVFPIDLWTPQDATAAEPAK